MTSLLTTDLTDTLAPPLDRDGRLVTPGDCVAWRGQYGTRTGRVARVEWGGEPIAVVLAHDSAGDVRVRCAGLRHITERRG